METKYTHGEWTIDELKIKDLSAVAPESLKMLIEIEPILTDANQALREHRNQYLKDGLISENEAKLTGKHRFANQDEYNEAAAIVARENKRDYNLLLSVREIIKKSTE